MMRHLLWGDDPPRLARFHGTVAEIRRERRRIQYARDSITIARAREILAERLAAVEAQERYHDEPLKGGD